MYKLYGATNHMSTTPLTYDLHKLQGQFMGFHDLILTLIFIRDSHSLYLVEIFPSFLVLNTRCF